MEEDFPDPNQKPGLRSPAGNGRWREKAKVVRDPGRPIDAQGLVHARNEEKHPDLRIDKEVGHGIQPVVATRSGSSSVRSSSIRTKPGGSPRGDTLVSSLSLCRQNQSE